MKNNMVVQTTTKDIIDPIVRTISYDITDPKPGQKISGFLKEKGYSEQNLVNLKKDPYSIQVNGSYEHQNYVLEKGDCLTVQIREQDSSDGILPVKLSFTIVYEDEDLFVIDKPAGMPIHPSRNNPDNSLGNALTWYMKEKGIPFVFRCINRLDRDTSGLTIVAKHMVSAAILSRMVAVKSKAGGIHREYLAIVQGIVEPSEGVIDAPIARKESACLERVIDFEKGDRAVTHYRKIAEKKHTLTCHSNFFLETMVYNDSPFYNNQCIPVRTNPSTTFLLCLSEILSYKSSKLLLLQTKTAYS